MSSFFSLGGSFQIHKDQHDLHQHQSQPDSIITPTGLQLVKNEDIYTKELELCQHYYHLHQLRQQHCSNLYMRQSGSGSGGGDHGSVGSGDGGGTNCQDCGNQAKKDCQHMRCRTCCKSKGFQCQTHVKSTWVSAAKRRERLQRQYGGSGSDQRLSLVRRGGGSGGAGGGDQSSKGVREGYHFVATGGGGGAVVVNLPSTHHQNVSQGLQMGPFPAEVSSPAVFRCVRVSAMAEAEEQLAYQTSVKIGGHVFKGILYDRGPMGRYTHPSGRDGSSATGDGAITPHQQLNLISSPGTMPVATTAMNPNVTCIDQSSILSTPLNAFMAGTQFFPPPRS